MGLGSLCWDIKAKILAASRLTDARLSLLGFQDYEDCAQITHLRIQIDLQEVVAMRRTGAVGKWETRTVDSPGALTALLSFPSMRWVRRLTLRVSGPTRPLSELEEDPFVSDTIAVVAAALRLGAPTWPCLRELKLDFTAYVALHLSGTRLDFPWLRRLELVDNYPFEGSKCVLDTYSVLLSNMPKLREVRLLTSRGVTTSSYRRFHQLYALATQAPQIARLCVSSEFVRVSEEAELKDWLRGLHRLELVVGVGERPMDVLPRGSAGLDLFARLPGLRHLRVRRYDDRPLRVTPGFLVSLVSAFMDNVPTSASYSLQGLGLRFGDWRSLKSVFAPFVVAAMDDGKEFALRLADFKGSVIVTGPLTGPSPPPSP